MDYEGISIDQTTMFVECMLMSMTGNGFKTLDNVAYAIDHYETMSGFCLTIE